MKRILAGFMVFSWSIALMAGPAAPQKPKLIVAVVVDQFRYDSCFGFVMNTRRASKRCLIRERYLITLTSFITPP